jgi:hypothetical protein
MICYKVVIQNKDGVLTSVGAANNPFRVTYHPGEYAEGQLYQHGYGLCAFNTLEDAQRFQGSRRDIFAMQGMTEKVFIYLSDGTDQIPLPRFIRNLRCYTYPVLVQYIQHNALNSTLFLRMWPKGTVMFRQIKLLKKVS